MTTPAFDEGTVSHLLNYYNSRLVDGLMSHDEYANEVRKLATDYPTQMQSIMGKNTDAKNRLLNDVEFNMDSYKADPWSRAGIADLPYKLQVAPGSEGSDRFESGRIGDVYGVHLPIAGETLFPGHPSLNTLRHEGSHGVVEMPNEEAAARMLDLLYAQKTNDKNEYRISSQALGQPRIFPTQLDMLAPYMQATQDNKMKVGNVPLTTGMSPQDQLNYLNTRSPTMLERLKGLFE